MPQIVQGTFNPAIAPRSVLTGHSDDQITDALTRSGPPHTSLATAVILLRNQDPAPPQYRLWSDKRLDPHQHSPAKRLALDRQAPTLVIAETDPLALVQHENR
jgi:hypothetical protein